MNGWWLEARMGDRIARPADGTILDNFGGLDLAHAVVGYTTQPLVALQWVRGDIDRAGARGIQSGRWLDTQFFTTKFLEGPAPTVE